MLTLLAGILTAEQWEIILGIILSVIEVLLLVARIIYPFIPEGKFKEFLGKFLLIAPKVIDQVSKAKEDHTDDSGQNNG